MERVQSLPEELLAQHTGHTPAQVREDSDRDLVMTAEAALAYGIVDAVLDRRAADQAARQTGPSYEPDP